MVAVTVQCEGGKRATIESQFGANLSELLVKFEDRVGQRLITGCEGEMTPLLKDLVHVKGLLNGQNGLLASTAYRRYVFA